MFVSLELSWKYHWRWWREDPCNCFSLADLTQNQQRLMAMSIAPGRMAGQADALPCPRLWHSKPSILYPQNCRPECCIRRAVRETRSRGVAPFRTVLPHRQDFEEAIIP
jgi:hypothetical protein